MSDETKAFFEDPDLKSAVRRCWACDSCPAELRTRIVQLLQSESTSTDGQAWSRAVLFRVPRSTWTLAAAAVVVLVLGLSFHYFQPRSQPIAAVTNDTLPSSLKTDLVIRHDLCCQEATHQHLPVPIGDDSAITATLESRLSRAVLVAHPVDPAWTFRGASICPVGTVPSGHLVFARGEDTLSIFSLPKSIAPGVTDGQEFSAISNGHSIAGFEKSGALFCLVGNSPAGTFTAVQLQEMRTRMEGNVTVAREVSPEPVVLTELLRPTGR